MENTPIKTKIQKKKKLQNQLHHKRHFNENIRLHLFSLPPFAFPLPMAVSFHCQKYWRRWLQKHWYRLQGRRHSSMLHGNAANTKPTFYWGNHQTSITKSNLTHLFCCKCSCNSRPCKSRDGGKSVGQPHQSSLKIKEFICMKLKGGCFEAVVTCINWSKVKMIDTPSSPGYTR